MLDLRRPHSLSLRAMAFLGLALHALQIIGHMALLPSPLETESRKRGTIRYRFNDSIVGHGNVPRKL